MSIREIARQAAHSVVNRDGGFTTDDVADAVAVGAGQAMPGVQSVEPAPTLRDTWAAARASRLSRAVSLGSGQLRALGIFDGTKPPPDPDGASLAPKPPCSYCDHARLCGQKVMA